MFNFLTRMSQLSQGHGKFALSTHLVLDVFSGITMTLAMEYLSNVGHTFHFYPDKYFYTMTSEVCCHVDVLDALLEIAMSAID